MTLLICPVVLFLATFGMWVPAVIVAVGGILFDVWAHNQDWPPGDFC